jgi:hypothetical protein
MAIKQMIVAICLVAAVLLAEARSANVPEEKIDIDPDALLTTVSFFLLLSRKRK